jgi:hypothetical protein
VFTANSTVIIAGEREYQKQFKELLLHGGE